MVWVPEVIETTSGNNIMFLSGWMCTAAGKLSLIGQGALLLLTLDLVMSALLLTAIFVVCTH